MSEILQQLKLEVNAHRDPKGSSVGVFVPGEEYVAVVVGGDIVRVSKKGGVGRARGIRREVLDWSDGAARRLRRRMEEIDFGSCLLFGDMTFGEFPDRPVLDVIKGWWERLTSREAYRGLYGVVRIEQQTRKGPHVHFALGGAEWVSHEWLAECWAKEGGGFTWVTRRDPESAMRYISKYVSKGAGPDAAAPPAKPAAAAEGDGAAVSLDLSTKVQGDGLREYGVKRRWFTLGGDNIRWKGQVVVRITRKVFCALKRIAFKLHQGYEHMEFGFTVRGCPRLAGYVGDGEASLGWRMVLVG